MAQIIPVGFAQATIPFQHASVGRTAVITWGVDVSGAGGDFVTFADDFFGYWDTAYGAFVDSQVVQGPVQLRVGQDGGDPIVVSGEADNPGAGGPATLPSNVALLIQKRTAIGGRKGRGRVYVPWIVGDDSADDVGILSGAAQTLLDDATADFLANCTDGLAPGQATPLVILHDSEASPPVPVPTPITALRVDTMVATQRRRLARGG